MVFLRNPEILTIKDVIYQHIKSGFNMFNLIAIIGWLFFFQYFPQCLG